MRWWLLGNFCVPALAETTACDAYPACVREGETGECCPTWSGVRRPCCDVRDAEPRHSQVAVAQAWHGGHLDVASRPRQPPNLRVGDCVQSTGRHRIIDIDFLLNPGMGGQVTATGIAWEKTNAEWKFSAADGQSGGQSGGRDTSECASNPKAVFQGVSREVVPGQLEKMDVAKGYGNIADGDSSKPDRQCLTVVTSDVVLSVRALPCVEGWTDQTFIYPGCGCGPGQIRWAKDPELCMSRQLDVSGHSSIVVDYCRWSRDWIWEISPDNKLRWLQEQGGTSRCLAVRRQRSGGEQIEMAFEQCSSWAATAMHFSGLERDRCQ